MFRVIFKIITWPFYHFLFWVRVENKKELRKYKKQGCVLVSNHLSNMDIPLMFHEMPREIHFLSKPELFKTPLKRWFFRGLNGYPIEQGKDLALMKHSISVLRRNKALVIFPEGMRVFNPEDALALKNGASLIAIKGNVPMIPMVINRPLKLFRLTRVKVGTAISTEEFQGRKVDKDELTAFSNKVSDIMADLLATPGFVPKEKKKKWWEKVRVAVSRAITFRVEDGVSKILLIKRKKPNYNDNNEYYVFPGGHLDEGEHEKEAVVREVFEETGINIAPLRILYKRIRTLTKDDNEMEAFFICEYKGGTITMNPESEEYQGGKVDKLGNPCGTYEPIWVPIDEIMKNDFDLKPRPIYELLRKDINKKGTRIVKPTRFLGKGENK